MGVFVLRVDVPEKRLGGVLGADKAVFAAHQQHIGQPQDLVELVLRHKGDADQFKAA